MGPVEAVQLSVDGVTVRVEAGASLLDACGAAGRYVPRLCYYPGLNHRASDARADAGACSSECGLCAVRLGNGLIVLACITRVDLGMEITTDDAGLRDLRLQRLAPILARHPHVCLSCPDRDGCTRDECTYGNPPDARCCHLLGRCELGRLVDYVDPGLSLRRRPVTVARTAAMEGRIRCEWGLCIGCARCVGICTTAPEAGRALEMMEERADDGGAGAAGSAARAKEDSLRASGCTFCGLCLMVCPTGALSAPGEEGARWLAGRREQHRPADPVLPPQVGRTFDRDGLEGVPHDPGVFELMDHQGQVVLIKGVADLRQGLTQALADPASSTVVLFRAESEPLFTQRESELLARYAGEHGHLPPANDLGDDLFADG